jgi:hypothetical protein
VVGLWPVALREDLRHALVDEDLRNIELFKFAIAPRTVPTMSATGTNRKCQS